MRPPPSSVPRPRAWLAAALALLAAAGCGPAPQEQGDGASGDTGAAAAVEKRRKPRGTRGAAAPWKPNEPVEVVEVDRRDLPALFSDRTPPVADAVAGHTRLFETDAGDWPTETLAERAEATLTELVEGLLAGVDGDGFELELRVGAAATVFDDGATRVVRRTASASGAEPQPQTPGELAAELRAAFAAPDGVEVSVLVTAIDGTADPRTEALCVLSSRASSSPAQVSLRLEARWKTPPDGGLVLDRLALLDLEQVRAPAPLFAELTAWVLRDADYYRTEILRGVDDYFMRIDRQGGSAFQGMQGLAVGDVNGDGLEDVYLCQQVGVPNRLLIKQPDGTAIDGSGEAKVRFLDVTRAALIVDLDGDGDRDLVLAVGPDLVLAYNDGAGAFADQQVLPGAGPEQIYNLSAADGDGDGDLDLYAARYALEGVMHGVPTPYHDAANGSTNVYWRNDGARQFADATEESGLGVHNTQFTLSSMWEDFDEDGDLDLYVVNDFGRNNLYRNDGTGRFEDVAESVGALDIAAGMGATAGDYDHDGDQDLFVTNMYSAPGMRISAQAERFMAGRDESILRWYRKHASGNSLLQNQGDGSFVDVTREAGVGLGRWGWGGMFTDFDNDGLEDLYVPCGHATSRAQRKDLEAAFWQGVVALSPADGTMDENYAAAFGAMHRMLMYDDFSWSGSERNVAYLNTGGARFADVSAVSGLDWPDDSRAAALVDWDEDGRVDILLKNRNGPRLRVLHNRGRSAGNWIAFELVGTECNRDAVGALVEVAPGDGRVLAERLHAGDGFLSQSSLRPHFGLGAASAGRVSVRWPGGEREDFGELAAGRRWRLVQGAGRGEPVPVRMPGAGATLAALEPLEGRWNPEPVGRVPLAARLPLAPFNVPAFEDPARRVRDLAGAPVLIVLYTASHPGGAAALSALAARAAELDARGLRVVPLATDQGPDLARARQLAERYGLGPVAGYADGRVLETFEIVFLEVFGYFRALPSPAALLLDPDGKLVVIYVGPPRAEEVLADLDVLASFAPGSLGTGRFGGGRWLVRRGRDFAGLAQVFAARGHVEIGRFYAELGR